MQRVFERLNLAQDFESPSNVQAIYYLRQTSASVFCIIIIIIIIIVSTITVFAGVLDGGGIMQRDNLK